VRQVPTLGSDCASPSRTAVNVHPSTQLSRQTTARSRWRVRVSRIGPAQCRKRIAGGAPTSVRSGRSWATRWARQDPTRGPDLRRYPQSMADKDALYTFWSMPFGTRPADSEPPPENLATIAAAFLASLYADADWNVVQRQLQQLARDHNIENILQRQQDAVAGIRNRGELYWYCRPASPRDLPSEATTELIERDSAKRSLVAELQEAAADYEASAAELVEKIPRAAEQAAKTPADAPAAKAAARIAEAIRGVDLTPAWMAVLLWWLLVMPSEKQLAAITLWLMVMTEVMKKRKKDGD